MSNYFADVSALPIKITCSKRASSHCHLGYAWDVARIPTTPLGSLKDVLLGQQTFDAALTTSKVAVPVQLNILLVGTLG